MTLPNPFDFGGKTVILAGATGGLGRPISLAFAAAGANIAACARSKPALDALATDMRGGTGRIFTSTVDLCDEGQVAGFVASVRERFGSIDILVNLVGGIIRKPSVDYALAEWQQIMDINLKACWLTCQVVGRVMIAQKRGRIVNFTSNAGMHGIPGYPAYSPAKAGVIALTRGLAVEWGPHGVSTNALSPGFADTPFNADVLGDSKRVENILRRMPLGSILPADALVGPTLFLASDAARWINGHVINVDAGFNAT
ncbi:MAG: SDR family oxidoreductase [Alphaproteobacteria bacterium]|nr:SDR family oxidoreductase [Alphaproteobacteria bacterium]